MTIRPDLSNTAFRSMVAQLKLEGDVNRMNALFEETKRSLARAGQVFEIDTTGYAPSPINPQFD